MVDAVEGCSLAVLHLDRGFNRWHREARETSHGSILLSAFAPDLVNADPR